MTVIFISCYDKATVKIAPDAEFCARGGSALVLACAKLIGGEVTVGVDVEGAVG